MEDMTDMWTCFTCDYVGFCGHDKDDDSECCPVCGTHAGDGFGMMENDPRYKPEKA